MRFPNLKLPDNSYAMQSITTNQENCADACLRNCSCVAYATTELIDCVTWFGDLLDVSEFNDGGDELYVRMAASELGMFLFLTQSRLCINFVFTHASFRY